MDTKHCLLLGIVLCLTAISESRVIVPRDRVSPKDKSFEEDGTGIINPVEAARPWKPEKGTPKDDDDDDDYTGIDPIYKPKDYIDPDNDYSEPDRGVNKKDDKLPGIKPERIPSDEDYDEWSEENPKNEDDADKSDDENIKKPFDEEDIDKYGNDDKDFEPPSDEDKPIYKGGDESAIGDTYPKSEEDSIDKEEEPKDYEKSDGGNKEEEEEFESEKGDEEEDVRDKEKKEPESNDEKEDIPEEEKHEPENDDDKKHIPEDEPNDDDDDDNKEEEVPKEVEEETVNDKEDKNNGEIIPPNGEAGVFSSIFDTPFFNLEQVKKYFSKLDRALGHVFRQTMDEALLLNGTYANTTEEEVDIGGKKYIITKSVIKGGDNHSSMYIEALSAKPKMNELKMMKDIEIKNMTFI